MNHVHAKQRYQDEEVVKCYDQKRFRSPIGRTIDALEKGASGFLCKPFSDRQLNDAMRKLIGA